MNLAIQITLFRIVLAPFFVYCFMKGVAGSIMLLWISLMIATVSEISDALDGILARRLNLVTDMGKVLDPLADSLSRMSAFLAFCGAGLVPVWMILVFFYRDSFVSTLRTLAASQNLILGFEQFSAVLNKAETSNGLVALGAGFFIPLAWGCLFAALILSPLAYYGVLWWLARRSRVKKSAQAQSIRDRI